MFSYDERNKKTLGGKIMLRKKMDRIEMLLHDKKEDLIISEKKNSIELIMEFFSTNDSNISDLENPKYNTDAYDELGWKEEKNFDVISSFWTVFACSVIREVNDNKEFARSKRFCKYPDYINYSTPWIPGGKYGYKNFHGEHVDSFPTKFLNYTGTKTIVDSTIKSYPKLNDLAGVCHSVANFMPCPSSPYNAAKGIVKKLHDFLPLFVDLIDGHCEDKTPVKFVDNQGNLMEISLEMLQCWKKWFVSNREKFCLEDYYYIFVDKNSIEHIKGIPFFKTQSINNPLPREKGEMEECLDEMVKRIYVRAFRLTDAL